MTNYQCPEFVPGLLTVEEITEWLNAVVDAQTEYYKLSPVEMALFSSADEYWGELTEWRETLKWAAWDTFD